MSKLTHLAKYSQPEIPNFVRDLTHGWEDATTHHLKALKKQ